MSAGKWLGIFEVIQKILSQCQVERLGKNELGKTQCPLEFLIRFKPSPILIRPSPLRRSHDWNIIDEERCNQLVDIEKMHNPLAQMHKTISDINQRRRSEAQKRNNAETNVIRTKIEVGDYVMVRTNAKKEHKLQTRWRRPKWVTEASHI